MCNNGQKLIEEGHEDSTQFKDLIEDLMDKWRQLKDAVDHRRNQLNQSEKAQQVSCWFWCFFSSETGTGLTLKQKKDQNFFLQKTSTGILKKYGLS